jgi:c-di-GMP phosphodiesterase
VAAHWRSGGTVVASPPPENTAPGMTSLTHIGRQPVYDLDDRVYGYELLFRPAAGAGASGVGIDDGDEATTTTIVAAFSEFGFEELLGGRFGFINLTHSFLTGRIPVPFGPEQSVLEVLETVEVDEDVVAGCHRLVDSGYTLALDDFVWTDRHIPLLEMADVVKLDVLEPTWDEVRATADRCRPFGVRLLAERIEDAAMLQRCREEGFELFQGYFLGRPQTLSVESLTPAHALALQLMAQLGEPDTTPDDVERLLRLDVGLTYRLLRIANSASNSLARKISSLRDAVVIVGMARLRAWLILITLSDLAGSSSTFEEALVVARTCELLARSTRSAQPDVAFTLGMLHGIADVLGIDQENLVKAPAPCTTS